MRIKQTIPGDSFEIVSNFRTSQIVEEHRTDGTVENLGSRETRIRVKLIKTRRVHARTCNYNCGAVRRTFREIYDR